MTQFELEDKILQLVNDRDDMPYTDVQGVAMAIAMQVKQEGVVMSKYEALISVGVFNTKEEAIEALELQGDGIKTVVRRSV